MSDIPPTQLSTASVMRPVYLTPCQRGDECAAAANCVFCQQGDHRDPVSVAATSTPTSRSDSGGLVVIAPKRSRSFLKHTWRGTWTFPEADVWEEPPRPYDTIHDFILKFIARMQQLTDHNQIYLEFRGEKGGWYELADYSLILADPDRIQTRNSIAPCYRGLPQAVTRRGFTMKDTLPDDHSDGRPATPDSEPGNLDAAAKARYFLASRHRLRQVNCHSIDAWKAGVENERAIHGYRMKHVLLEQGTTDSPWKHLDSLYQQHPEFNNRVVLGRVPTESGHCPSTVEFGLFAKEALKAGDPVSFYGGVIVHQSVYKTGGIAFGQSHSHARRIPNTDYIMDGLPFADMIPRVQQQSSIASTSSNEYQPSARFWTPWQIAEFHASPMGYMMNTALPLSTRGNNCELKHIRFANGLVDIPAIYASRDIAAGEELLCPYNDRESKLLQVASSPEAVHVPAITRRLSRVQSIAVVPACSSSGTEVVSELLPSYLVSEESTSSSSSVRLLIPADGNLPAVYEWPEVWDTIAWQRVYTLFKKLDEIGAILKDSPDTTVETFEAKGYSMYLLNEYALRSKGDWVPLPNSHN